MVNKVIVLGLGSMGCRHVRNLAIDCTIIGADPRVSTPFFNAVFGDLSATYLFEDWHIALQKHEDADCAIIASPTAAHLNQALALRAAGIPFYCEKPIGDPGDLEQWRRLNNNRCAIGYQYRFHPVYRAASQMIKRNGHVRFYARDDLLSRYGRDCLSAIAAHPVDTALWLLGPAENVDMQTDGFSVRGVIRHAGGGVSEHNYRIDTAPRVSMVSTLRADGMCYDGWPLTATNDMYIDALAAWLRWVEGGERDTRTAMLEDGVRSLEVMAEVKHV